MTEMLSAPRFVYLWHRYLALGAGLLVVFGAAYFSARSTAPAVFRFLRIHSWRFRVEQARCVFQFETSNESFRLGP